MALQPLKPQRTLLIASIRFALTLATAALVLGCCLPESPPSEDIGHGTIATAPLTKPQGVCVIVHGLNQLPETMDPIANYVRGLGYHTYRITLSGHERAGAQPFSSTTWERDLDEALRLVETAHPNLPLHIIGYSLGGLITTRVLDSLPQHKPSSVVLLAPALSLRLFPQAGYVTTLFPPLSWSIPNIAPRYYRRFARTPIFWYQNTFELYSKTRNLSSAAALSTIPTLVIANPRDELVSLIGLQGWLKDNQLTNSWRLSLIRPKPRDPFIPEHVIIDERSLGAEEWTKLELMIRDFIIAHSQGHR